MNEENVYTNEYENSYDFEVENPEGEPSVFEQIKSALEQDEPSDVLEEKEELGFEGVVNYSSLNVRSGSSEFYDVITVITQGTKVKILDESEDHKWYKVKFDIPTGEVEGYCMQQYIDVL